jgi:DNA-binding NarL/FixJ family response regulator
MDIAMRDMSRKEFNAALARRGWRKVMMWIQVDDRRSIGMVMRKGRSGYRINRRASLAKAIREAETVS